MKNVGRTDQVIRIAAGASLVTMAMARRGAWRWAVLPGLELLYTAYKQYCPIHAALGINTHREPEAMPAQHDQSAIVQESSEESFPASDPPAWTMGRS